MNPAWYDLLSQQSIDGIALDHIAIDERVVAYGDGFFTTMAVVAGQINWLDYHLQRIEVSCRALQLTLPALPVIERALISFAKRLQHGVLKLILCRKNQPVRGYGFVNGACHAWLKVMPSEQPLANVAHHIIIQPAAQAVCLSQQIACLPKPLAGLKLLNAQDKALASRELLEWQAGSPTIAEGLVQDVSGQWVEGTVCNVFYQLAGDNVWHTPPVTQSGVAGVMRQVILDREPSISERPLTDSDLPKLTGLFFCNAVRGIIPITALRLPDNFLPKALTHQLPKKLRYHPSIDTSLLP